jgi:ComF family protein
MRLAARVVKVRPPRYPLAMDAEPAATVAAGGSRFAAWRAAAAAVARAAVDVVLPAQCLACRVATAEEGSLCAGCWSRLRLIEKPYCARLGVPFAYDLGEGALSAEAIADPPPFDRCRAVATFDEIARALVHGLKYRDRPELARAMGEWMVRAGGEIVATADVIVPVPLHHRRLWLRRFNQSALLAQAVARRAGKPFAPAALTRIRATEQQVGLSQAARDDNVRGAFRVLAEARPAVAGRRALLVDDVYTTGATVKAASRALLRGGAAAVDVLVFARVVRAGA